MLDKFTSMEVVRAVAREGNFSAAARSLGISQQMVSKHVEALEETLHTRLFNRTTRSVRMTPICERYLAAISSMLDTIKAVEEEIAGESSDLKGSLRVSAPKSLFRSHVVPASREFLSNYPHVALELATSNSHLDDNVDERDVAITFGSRATADVNTLVLSPTRGVVVASPGYLERHGRPRTASDLASHLCLLCGKQGVPQRVWLFGQRGDIVVPIGGNFFTEDWETIRLAALEDVGVAYLADYMVEQDIAQGSLLEIPLDVPPGEYLPLCAVFHRSEFPPARLVAFLDVLAATFAAKPAVRQHEPLHLVPSNATHALMMPT